MSYLQDFAHSFQSINRVRPEQKAVPTTLMKPLLRELAMREGGERMNAMRNSNQRYQNMSALSEYTKDLKAARRDAPVAMAVEGANLALAVPIAQEQNKIIEQYKKWNSEYTDQINSLNELVKENYEKYVNLLNSKEGGD